MIQWADGVNQMVRRGSDWELPLGVILDKTKSGKKQSRPSNQLEGKKFNVQMIFSYEEYLIFESWYEINLRNGALTFAFPDIITGLVDREYRIISKGKGSNESGKIIRLNMVWEEVR